MLRPIAFSFQQVGSAYVIDITMMVYAVFTMFVDFKIDSEIISRAHKKEGCLNSSICTVSGGDSD